MQVTTLNNYGTIRLMNSSVLQVINNDKAQFKQKRDRDFFPMLRSTSSMIQFTPDTSDENTKSSSEQKQATSHVYYPSESNSKNIECSTPSLCVERSSSCLSKKVKRVSRQESSIDEPHFSESKSPAIALKTCNNFDIPSLRRYEQILKDWTCANSMELIYDSSKHFFDSKGFNENVCGSKNVMIIVMSGKSIFGSWHSKKIPKEKKEGFVYVKGDENHFMFTLKNPYKIPPTRFFPIEVNKHTKSLCVSGSRNSACVVGVYSGYFIDVVDNSSSIDYSFNTNYEDHTSKGGLVFVGNQSFTTDRLLAFNVL
ncbi:hypothetical protein EIN_019300 [Entamoeba invadens IP1]|uniref:hypothetical protein n=1 Tax=Entamoeba invadens IP1 TaxID=370355 RepID=UPI0002C3F592|nr:hypothetical protein EIN_019300 [Entamoeba invadens IP1]ELP90541.1 hypothetical protein EIN_019300 [Entamoeba invadens IP1]|eukprot:XP_004257312.1 hypothetical protein EIN_019300 [Entamoeba invadens IP1]